MFQMIAKSIAVLILAAGTAAAQDSAEQLRSLVEKKASSIVSIRAVLKTEINMMGQSQDEEVRVELQGTIVDATGLVLISNSAFSLGNNSMFGGQGMDVSVTPMEIKVVIEGEDTEFDAFRVATDSKLDIAFLQIEELGARTLTPVEFGDTPELAIGQKIATVGRYKKGYDYAPYFATGRINGMIKKPRRAWTLEGGIATTGTPIFTLDGTPIGIIAAIDSGVEEDENTMGFNMMMRMLGGDDTQEPVFLFPATALKGTIAQAKKRSEELVKERAEEKAKEEEKKKEEKTEEPGEETETPEDHSEEEGEEGSDE
jgi:S1-C subfamily serine protease